MMTFYRRTPVILWGIGIILVVLGCAYAGVSIGTVSVRDVVVIAGPAIGLVSLFTAVLVAYLTWLSPFDADVIARPMVWRLGSAEQSLGAFNVVYWLTIINKGALGGTLTDVAIDILLPKGRWILQPIAVVDGDEYFKLFFGKKFEHPPTLGPFHPLFLAGRTEQTLAVMFVPDLGGTSDFDPSILVHGEHIIRLHARYDGGPYRLVKQESFIVPEDEFDQWQSGNQISGMVVQSDKPRRELIPKPVAI